MILRFSVLDGTEEAEVSLVKSSKNFSKKPISQANINSVLSLIDWLIDWLTDWLIDWLVDWLIDWLMDGVFLGTFVDCLSGFLVWFIARLFNDGLVSCCTSTDHFLSQIAVIKEFQMLISLSDTIVSIHDFGSESGSFPTLDSITKTRGATMFAISTVRDPAKLNEPKVTMCVVVRQRLLVRHIPPPPPSPPPR